jgi:hypothetical protein|tara:strand:+ start:643 stop:1047 length:405 start_codon:yes stop_codon:yes gene_type:complete
MNPFDYVNSINYSKKNLMENTDNDKLAESGYNPFITNRSLSYFTDTIFYVNEVNQYSHTANKLQYDYLLNSIRPKKRFSKWVKNVGSDDLENVKLYFNYSTKKGLQALNILSPKQLQEITSKVTRGIKDGPVSS